MPLLILCAGLNFSTWRGRASGTTVAVVVKRQGVRLFVKEAPVVGAVNVEQMAAKARHPTPLYSRTPLIYLLDIQYHNAACYKYHTLFLLRAFRIVPLSRKNNYDSRVSLDAWVEAPIE
jgi:hypothetical protein